MAVSLSLHSPLAGRLVLVMAAVLWSFAGLLIKLVNTRHGVPPEAIACIRSAIAGVALAWALPGVRPSPKGRVAAAGIVYAVLVGTFVLSTTGTTAANAIFLQYSYPLIVAVGARLLYSERISGASALALAVGMSGVGAIVVGGWVPGHSGGVAWGLLSAAAFAAFTLIQRGIPVGNPVGLSSAYNLIAAASLLPLAIGKFHLTAPALLLIAVMAFCLGGAYILYIHGLRVVPVVEAALITLLEPVLNPVWVWLGTGETPGLPTVAGGSLIMLALALRFAPALRRRRGR